MSVSEFAVLRERARLSRREAASAVGCSLSTIYRWEQGASPQAPALVRLRELAGVYGTDGSDAERPTFIDLFAGIGGMRLGFELAGGQCVFTSEWDRFSRKTYCANFPVDHDIRGDINEVDPGEIPDHDILLAGFPCQPFSIAGVSKKNSLGRAHGFEDVEQGNLFFAIHRILEAKRPAAFLLENVRNLLSHDRGRTFDVIYRLLGDGSSPPIPPRQSRLRLEDEANEWFQRHSPLGYRLSFRIIDAQGWLPQHRERIFIVGFRDDVPFTLDDLHVPDTASGPRLDAVLHSEDEEPDERFLLSGIGVNPRYTLTPHLWEYLQEYAESHRQRGNGFGFGLVGPNDVARTLSARYYKDGSEILIDQPGKPTPRRLTPRECARLMGFDAFGESNWKIPVSDTQAYRQFGNAVAVPVVEHIARAMLPAVARVTRQSIPEAVYAAG